MSHQAKSVDGTVYDSVKPDVQRAISACQRIEDELGTLPANQTLSLMRNVADTKGQLEMVANAVEDRSPSAASGHPMPHEYEYDDAYTVDIVDWVRRTEDIGSAQAVHILSEAGQVVSPSVFQDLHRMLVTDSVHVGVETAIERLYEDDVLE